MAAVTPTLAQRPHNGGQGHQGGGHEQHGNNAPRHEGNGQQHQGAAHQNHPQGHFEGDRGRHTRPADRSHFDGRHFDRDWHRGHFGREHRFHIGRPVFYGGYWRFWYGGFWFNYYDPWPEDWCYCDQVYIDYDTDSDCYFMYNPVHPGFRIRIGVLF